MKLSRFTSLKFSLFLALFCPLHADLLDELQGLFGQEIRVKNIKILPKDYQNCSLLQKPQLNSSGFFFALCDEKKRQFRYLLQGEKQVLKLRKNALKGEKLTRLDFESDFVDFSKVPYNALSEFSGTIRIKSALKKGTILSQKQLMPNFLVNKNDEVLGVLDDGNLSVLIDLVAISSGTLGQKIRLKNPSGRVIFGEVIGEKKVKIY